ncbi:DUF4278 domain-containing protein [Nostoc sp. FACHB-152]|uniref:DUF4278 domain-containing protein n=1 Tax=unclassified Nostoc TaxID=2593658 RepID=UPI0016897E8A|nr:MULTISPECIES: DUF4278 domain-containing protein [unclassified Nostoc]MBD2446127.1 DUF4278 domain-containing protein [Nostoc sp. FACHB-152]MBD2467359.1 DUF4278 domain-containing protein [Nostoc sp. FACHB-145]
MKLYYRGQTYEYQPSQKAKQPFQPVHPSGKPYNLRYRGITYHVDPNNKSAEVPVLSTTYKLMYRGVTYIINKNAQREVTIVSQAASFANLESVVLES